MKGCSAKMFKVSTTFMYNCYNWLFAQTINHIAQNKELELALKAKNNSTNKTWVQPQLVHSAKKKEIK